MRRSFSNALLAVTFVSLPLLAIGAGGCGPGSETSSEPGELTCAILEAEDNCWAATAASLADCLPAGETGILAADRASCTFSDGTVITFDEALPNSTDGLFGFGFTISQSGEQCGRFVDTAENRMEMSAGTRSVSAELGAGSVFTLDCGDGVTYETDFSTLFECAAGSGPTDAVEVTATSVTFQVISSATLTPLFQCASAVP